MATPLKSKLSFNLALSSLPRDSVFAPTQDILPPEYVLPTLERLEGRASKALTAELDATIQRVINQSEGLITRKDIKGVLELSQGLNVALQRPITGIWLQGWSSGSEHAIAEMQAAIPDDLKLEAESFALTDTVKRHIRALLQFTPGTFRNLPAERSIQRRVLKLAGVFAKNTLDRVKADLLSAIAPQPDTGEPISRDELLKRLQSTMNVSRVRADIVARTEVGAAYNQGRLATFRQSKLVTHLIFYSIHDTRRTDICESRSGMILPIDDKQAIAQNTPPCHFRCRSSIGSLMPDINAMHLEIVSDASRLYSNRKLVPLMAGWRSP